MKENENKRVKIALYARVSTDEQVKKYSIPAQLDLLRGLVKTNNCKIFGEYVDKRERPLSRQPVSKGISPAMRELAEGHRAIT